MINLVVIGDDVYLILLDNGCGLRATAVRATPWCRGTTGFSQNSCGRTVKSNKISKRHCAYDPTARSLKYSSSGSFVAAASTTPLRLPRTSYARVRGTSMSTSATPYLVQRTATACVGEKRKAKSEKRKAEATASPNGTETLKPPIPYGAHPIAPPVRCLVVSFVRLG